MSYRCKKCGGTMRIANNRGIAGERLRPSDEAMGTHTRQRTCACGYSEHTVELSAAELSELRRATYLYRMTQIAGAK
jgi:hypothetical protein